MPCSFLTHGWPAAAPPQDASRLPSGSNFRTGGAALQHLVCGGLACAPFSSSSRVAGRWMIQMLSWPSTAMPATWPRIQFSGSGFGQNGSGWNFGAACWAMAFAGSNRVAATATPDSTHAPTRALMAASLEKSGRVRKVGSGYLRRLNLPGRGRHRQPVQLLGDHDLAGQARIVLKVMGGVEHVAFFHLRGRTLVDPVPVAVDWA